MYSNVLGRNIQLIFILFYFGSEEMFN